MKCKTNYLLEKTERIENLWEIRFSLEKAQEIKQIAKTNQMTFSMVLRYCTFRFLEILANELDRNEEISNFYKVLPHNNLNSLRISEVKFLNNLQKKDSIENGDFGMKSSISVDPSRCSMILSTIQDCYSQRQIHNQLYHRFMVCLYGSDEALLRQYAMKMGISVSLLIRTAVELFLSELADSRFVSDELILKYAIKHSIVMLFHNKNLEGSDSPGNCKISFIYFPKWKYWSLRRARFRFDF